MKTMECKVWLSHVKELTELIEEWELNAASTGQKEKLSLLKANLKDEMKFLESLEPGTIVRID